MSPLRVLVRVLAATTIMLGMSAAIMIATGNKAAAESLVIGDLPAPGEFDPVSVSADSFNNTISYSYLVGGVPVLSGSGDSGTFGTPVASWIIGFRLGTGFTDSGLTGNAAHIDLTLTDLLPDSSLSLGDFRVTSNVTPPGHPPPGYIGGGGRGAGLIDATTLHVPGHPDELELLADLAAPTSTVDNEYDLVISGLMAPDGRNLFSITGPVAAENVSLVPLPASILLFGAALLGLCATRLRVSATGRRWQRPARQPAMQGTIAA